ncbi:Crp/Fnr family transcriptional regulator [Clostridium tyrobutyricum]|uniref:Crp/Fnr family transcriptional regulator n=1 Tax=Clostridium tyrobutyricum TaxID=1519 RepID=UPI001C3CC69D|nr:Crp/Fnr family transcriptional regulator [Clostridium tyrobutyricum]MBV4436970.1 Crp/Fnr family transcriptional regulator [Clostridium tyrobutyricum]
MDVFIGSLKKCILMNNFTENNIKDLLSKINYIVKNYEKDEVIAIEDSHCAKIGILLDGNVEVQKIYASGKNITISKLNIGNIFGEVIIFSNKNKYPATIISSNNSKILFISKENILKLCSISPIFLNNFMALLSNKILMLNKKVKSMSYQTLRQKICFYIIEQYKFQNNSTIKLNMTKKEIAEQLGVPRPSLSRELINMKNENLIEMNKNTITIKDIDYMYELLD